LVAFICVGSDENAVFAQAFEEHRGNHKNTACVFLRFITSERVYEMEDLLQVGVITQTHGIKGEVKVFPTTDDVNRFKKLKNVILDTGKENLELEIEGVKFFKQYAILKFKGIDNINDIEKYKGKSLLVTRENAVKLKKNEYFIADMIGMKVVTEDESEFGTLVDVMATGANDVYVIETIDKKEVLLPAIKQCVLDIDIEKQIMKVHIMKGLLD
jgi:16S rRNA processing protein RimM